SPTSADMTDIGNTTRRGFTSHEHLDNIGLIHMNGRVYDPTIGRFLSADPFVPDPFDGQSFNRYSYVKNNPLSRIDADGFEDLAVKDVPGQSGPGTYFANPVWESNSYGLGRWTVAPGFGIGAAGMMGIAGGFDDKTSRANYLAMMQAIAARS